MDAIKRKRLEARGWRVGTVQEFLGLSDLEAAMMEIRLSLADAVAELRKSMDLTQEQLARVLGSSQSRVSKMEAPHPSVSLDLMVRSLVKLGATRDDIARAISVGGRRRRSPEKALARK